MLDGISVMVGVKEWLGDETDATFDGLARTPDGCAAGDGELDWPWGVSDADGGAVSLPTPVFNVKSLENEVDVVEKFDVFVVRGLSEALPAVEDDDAVASDGFDVVDEGRTTDSKDFVDEVVVALDSMDAAPGPLPAAGTEPTCLVVAAMEGPPSVEDKAAVSDGLDIVDEGRAADGAVVALDSMDAAPGPLPTAGTEPTCFEGRTLETAAACGSGRELASAEGVDVARVEGATTKLWLVEWGGCCSGTTAMVD